MLNATSSKYSKLFLVSCPSCLKNFMKVHSSIFRYVANRHAAAPSLRNIKQSSYVQRQFTRFSIMLQTGTDSSHKNNVTLLAGKRARTLTNKHIWKIIFRKYYALISTNKSLITLCSISIKYIISISQYLSIAQYIFILIATDVYLLKYIQ